MNSAEKAELDRVSLHADQLAEHFDSVQIFVTRKADNETEEDGTVNINFGRGNWFARYGQVQAWLIKSEEWTRMEARKSDD